MANDLETPETVDEAAAGWAARMDRGPLSEQDAEGLETWLAGDARRLGALMRARALFQRSESAWSLEPVFNPHAFRRRTGASSRRGFLKWGAGGAIAASAGTIVVGYMLTATRSYATARGEVRQVPLADGSNLTLNTLSEVKVHTRANVRDIRLVTGEVLVALAEGQKGGLVLRVGDWRLQADDAAFFVSDLAEQPAQVTVHRGAVRVIAPDAGGGLRLEQGRRLRLTGGADPARRIETVTADQMSRELAWREGQLAFHGESLGQAALAFSRYSQQPIVIRDKALAGESVTGLFAANDPVGFARAIGLAFDADVRVEQGRVLIG